VVTPTTLTSLPPANEPSAPTSVSGVACSKHDKYFFDYIGKTFTDTDDNLHFQITNIVILCNSHQKNPTLFFRYFKTAKFPTAPLIEHDYENTPCSEFVKKRRGTGIIFSPPFIVWDTPNSSAGSAISILAPELTAHHTTLTFDTLGANFLASWFSQYSEYVPTFIQTGEVFSAKGAIFFLLQRIQCRRPLCTLRSIPHLTHLSSTSLLKASNSLTVV